MAQNFWHFSKFYSKNFQNGRHQTDPIKVDLMSTYEMLLSIYQFCCEFVSQTLKNRSQNKLNRNMHHLKIKTLQISISAVQTVQTMFRLSNKMDHLTTKQLPSYMLQIQMILSI